MEYKYFLCLEYKNPTIKNYRKVYFSFGPNGLIYDSVYHYSLEMIDSFLSQMTKSQIINQMYQDNILYFTEDIQKENYFELSIRHFEKEKERSSVPILKEGCYTFPILEFFQNDLNLEARKKIYNKLGGYIVNPHTTESTKKWIKNLPFIEVKQLIQDFLELPYEEQRKIKMIIFEEVKKENHLEKRQILKKTQDKVA